MNEKDPLRLIEQSDVNVIIDMNKAIANFYNLSDDGKERYVAMLSEAQKDNIRLTLQNWMRLIEKEK
jgi:hypothetical protein